MWSSSRRSHDLGGLGTSAWRKERDASESLPQANFKTLKGNQVDIEISYIHSLLRPLALLWVANVPCKSPFSCSLYLVESFRAIANRNITQLGYTLTWNPTEINSTLNSLLFSRERYYDSNRVSEKKSAEDGLRGNANRNVIQLRYYIESYINIHYIRYCFRGNSTTISIECWTINPLGFARTFATYSTKMCHVNIIQFIDSADY